VSPVHSSDNNIILFDGICNLCNGAVNFIIDHDPGINFRFAALQSDAGREILINYGLNEDYSKSIILIRNGKVFRKSRAILEIARQLKGMSKFFYVFIIIPVPVLNIFYNLTAKYRYRIFGKCDSCRVPTPELLQRFITGRDNPE
jgi:predicted DCC family thiol-disulfide oxidoreductase YuxK